ncbi:MAG: chemotaxis protein CheA [Candidatus Accumulibacter sp. UW26]|jgi:two-component system chemotaxis sensor kinase CheA
MSPLLEQFLSEARDFLQGIGEKLMQLEVAPHDQELMTALFRLVHTLKGNSGLFDFPEMTRVLHAGEDLMDAVRQERVPYSKELADRLLDAMDFVGMLCDEVEADDGIGATHAAQSARLAESLRQLISDIAALEVDRAAPARATPSAAADDEGFLPALADIPEATRMAAYRRAAAGECLSWLDYVPAEECFFQGDDPFFQARGTPGLLWGDIRARQPWPKLAELDAYRCLLDFHLLSAAPSEELDEYFRYMPEEVSRVPVPPLFLALPQGEPNGGPVYEDFGVDALALLNRGDLDGLRRAAQTLLELSGPELWLSSALRWLLLVIEVEPQNREALAVLLESLTSLAPPRWGDCRRKASTSASSTGSIPPRSGNTLTAEDTETLTTLVGVQREILTLPVKAGWQLGRLKAVAAALAGCLRATGALDKLPGLEAATAAALAAVSATPLRTWLDATFQALLTRAVEARDQGGRVATAAAPVQSEPKFGRRAEDALTAPKSLKVDQAKIDRLMNLIGEMIVSKNALPYLAVRAENVFHVRELAREIKAQYAIVNRIAEEMQDAIMQVRMMPVSFVFQRFPRLVRDTANRLGKEVSLVLEGEETEADKNIIESLGDPLLHIVRNSLDHGFEPPEVRSAAGKPMAGTLTIRARQESDRVLIEISDDGKGIDPEVIKRKAYEKGLIDEAVLERLSDQEAVNLVFASGFSTVEVVSDLSGRGVGMDAVRTAVEKVNGSVTLESEKGRGTRIRLSLPLSMAITNVMIVESDGQIFGVPMESVVETVRIARSAIRTIKKSLATVLRGRIVPLKSINSLLGIDAPPKANGEEELAVLVVRLGEEPVGLLVDDFRETMDILLKPMSGVLSGLPGYAGSALMGDGSVLMVLNVRELM